MKDLIARLEAATGPDRELDAEIAAAVRYFPRGVGFVWQDSLTPNSPELGRVECCTSLGTGGPHYAAPTYTASLDSALTLFKHRPHTIVTNPLKVCIEALCTRGSDHA